MSYARVFVVSPSKHRNNHTHTHAIPRVSFFDARTENSTRRHKTFLRAPLSLARPSNPAPAPASVHLSHRLVASHLLSSRARRSTPPPLWSATHTHTRARAIHPSIHPSTTKHAHLVDPSIRQISTARPSRRGSSIDHRVVAARARAASRICRGRAHTHQELEQVIVLGIHRLVVEHVETVVVVVVVVWRRCRDDETVGVDDVVYNRLYIHIRYMRSGVQEHTI